MLLAIILLTTCFLFRLNMEDTEVKGKNKAIKKKKTKTQRHKNQPTSKSTNKTEKISQEEINIEWKFSV